MTDKHIINKDNGEPVRVEDARSKMERREAMVRAIAAHDPTNDVLAIAAQLFSKSGSPDKTPVIETPRVVRTKFGGWLLDFDAGVGTVTLEHEKSVAEFNVAIEDLAALARVLPAFLAEVVE